MDAFLVGLNDQIATRILELFPGPRSLAVIQTIASRIDDRYQPTDNLQIIKINQKITIITTILLNMEF